VVGAEPYDVTCACGQRHAGVRDPEYQVLECDRCSRRLFVLPECPYPDINEPAAADDDQLPPTARSAPKSNRPAQHQEGRRRPKRTRDAAAATGGSVDTVSQDKLPNPDAPSRLLMRPRRKIVTPLRLVAIGIVALLATTGYWKYRQSIRAAAERDFREHADRGEAALKDRNFPAAFKEYEQAVAALDRLGRDDEKARQVRQMFRECRAASDLASKTLPEMLEDARRWAAADPKSWERKFRSDYGGQWIVLDTLVSRATAKDGDEFVQIDFLLAAGGRPVDLIVPGTAFDTLQLDDKPQRAILAVEVASCELVGAKGGRWVVKFNPKTAFLWTDFDNYHALGFNVAEDSEAGGGGNDELETERIVRDRLLKQAKMMGLSK
jgi:hypothetical protein